MSDSYFVITTNEDGEVFLRQQTYEQLYVSLQEEVETKLRSPQTKFIPVGLCNLAEEEGRIIIKGVIVDPGI